MINTKQFMNIKVGRNLTVHSFCQRRIRHTTQCPRVCVIGSGPAGFYTAQQLLKVTTASHMQSYLWIGLSLISRPVPFSFA